MNSQALRRKMAEIGVTQGEMASKIGLSLSRFNAKLNGWRGAEFTLHEIKIMRQLLELDSTATEFIFFTEEVS